MVLQVQLVDLANVLVSEDVATREWRWERENMSQQVNKLLKAMPN